MIPKALKPWTMIPIPKSAAPENGPESPHFWICTVFLGIQNPIVLGVRPSNYGVITYYFVGFGVTGNSSSYRTPTFYYIDILGP